MDRRHSFVDAFLFSPLSAQEAEEEEEGAEDAEEEEVNLEQELISTGDGLSEFTPSELDILQRLSDRRVKLEEWQRDLITKENILNITQTKIDQKIDDLRVLKEKVESLLEQYNAKEVGKTQRLIKVYESMKPKDAANIFAELDNETLMQVVEKMKEAKLALILANMDPKRARDITVEFSKRRRLPASEAGEEAAL